ncbi:nitroreductase family protein [Rhodoblastus sp.]|uniref:nitroreductase family protein n=1 Tax=Rhodoblastus sp. TaxID=1962975 RepID=UPI00263297C5|nr:nitroreductase family protein [Rhodoblastus sp.]
MSKPDPSLVALVSQAGGRSAATPVSSLFIGRWSPRAMTAEPIPDEILFALFEAARYAPSSRNSQPWRFAYARRGEPDFAIFLGCLNDDNRDWARNASALVMIASKAIFTLEGSAEKHISSSASFDAGAAWASLAFQAELLGWSTRAMGAFDRDLARAASHAPDTLKIEVIVAIGKRGDASLLPPERRSSEKPKPRKAMDEIVFAGGFPADC